MSNSGEIFSFIGFNDETGAILSYGHTAAETLKRADKEAPAAALIVIPAGNVGLDIWDRRLGLDEVRTQYQGLLR
jgi:hypothetical protein